MRNFIKSLKSRTVGSLALTTLALSTPGLALTLVIEPKELGQTKQHEISPYSDVGVTTVKALESLNIPYEGSEAGITSINGLKSDLEALSDTRMKAWGWCYSVDGEALEVMPDKAAMPANAKVLKWFYAYALYDSGTWVGYCIQDK